ncbi:MAG TPA: DUF5668 domain-containing protein [Acidobacteriaceae bacterium]|jgi:hypothetical protein|nr:DUF5668 domain-containing protein [Acidobacteriaceae bacterium]
MTQWYHIRRMRLPAFLILVGILALLDQWHILRFGKSWPLFLILAGIMAFAERAAWAAGQQPQQGAYNPPGQPYGAYPPPVAPGNWPQNDPTLTPHDNDPEQRR